ncbi:MAG: protein phosphatase 2C domain-containing protein [Elainellaceae cyanobacterium]
MPLPKRYLWAVGKSAEAIEPGQIISERYLCKAPRIFLDTQPGLPPATLSQFPPAVLPYLRLATYQIHVPQAYGWMQYEHPQEGTEAILLLEYAAIAIPAQAHAASAAASRSASELCLLPSLSSQWQRATAMRQLNWLWQLAKLWQPLAVEQVVSSLVDPELIRVEEFVVRLVELRSDRRTTQNVGASLFAKLGQTWMQWVPTARPEIRTFLEALCNHLIDGKIQHPGQLLVCLDRALIATGKAQHRQISMATQTDRGPSRPRNEDACFPSKHPVIHLDSRQTKTPPLDSSLIIVCDGIGGHSGGDVASQSAIDTLYSHLDSLHLSRLSPVTLSTELRRATCLANDVISERNDDEQRRDRDRMGTTLVMGLLHRHELYLTHLGDSRAYLITGEGCHQATLDDDVASREARLGYGTYRNALYQPSAGSLVQALGMSASGSLHPTVQRLVLEGKGAILLCSDGLSDNDLLDSTWQTYITPLLQGKVDILSVVKQLIAAANQYNGHDNVTIGLISWSVTPAADVQLSAELAMPPALTSSISPQPNKTRLQHSSAQTKLQSNASSDFDGDFDETAKTQLITPQAAPVGGFPDNSSLEEASPSQSSPLRLLPLLLSIAFLLVLGSVFAYILLPSVSDRIDLMLGIDKSLPSDELDGVGEGNGSSPSFDDFGSNEDVLTFDSGDFIQVSRSGLDPDQPSNLLVLLPQPQTQADLSSNATGAIVSSDPVEVASASIPSLDSEIEQPHQIPAGSILKVLGKQEVDNQGLWVRLQLCSLTIPPEQMPSSVEPIPPQAEPNTDLSPQGSSVPDISPGTSPNTSGSQPSTTDPLQPSQPIPVALLSLGQTGWIAETRLAPAVVNVQANPSVEVQGECQPIAGGD